MSMNIGRTSALEAAADDPKELAINCKSIVEIISP
jgi:hypothetical protein